MSKQRAIGFLRWLWNIDEWHAFGLFLLLDGFIRTVSCALRDVHYDDVTHLAGIICVALGVLLMRSKK